MLVPRFELLTPRMRSGDEERMTTSLANKPKTLNNLAQSFKRVLTSLVSFHFRARDQLWRSFFFTLISDAPLTSLTHTTIDRSKKFFRASDDPG